MNRHILAKWLLVIFFGIFLPLPYFNELVGGFAPLAHLWMIALGDHFFPALIPLNFLYCIIYSTAIYFLARFTADRLLAAGALPRAPFIGIMLGTPVLIALLPIYGIGAENLTLRSLPGFIGFEIGKFRMMARSTRDDRPRRMTRSELLGMTNTIVHSDIAVNVANQTSPVGQAWWLRTMFAPMSETVRGFRASELNPDWVRVSELRLDALPRAILEIEMPRQDWTPSFSLEGDFNDDGVMEAAFVGVYEERTGHIGTFVAILTTANTGQRRVAACFNVSSQPEVVGLSKQAANGSGLRVFYCTNCDTGAEIVWNGLDKRYEFNFDEPPDLPPIESSGLNTPPAQQAIVNGQ
jgi:hypothetical protein